MTPDAVNIILQEILDCVCAALADSAAGCPCNAFIATGQVAWDNCCECGQLWVRMTDLYLSGNFPARQTDTIHCGIGMAMDVSVGLLRCAPVIDDNGNPPSPDELTISSLQTYEEMYRILNALVCCLSVNKRHQQFRINGYTPLGPNGGCVGSELRLSIQIADPPIVNS